MSFKTMASIGLWYKLLVWDLSLAHIGQDIESFMKPKGVLSAVIPGGLPV